MLKDINQVFAVKELALENMDLLPETPEKVIYVVTATQEKSKNFFYIGFTSNLRKKFKKHNREVEFEFLKKIGYQINIFWVVLPKGITQREAQAVEMCYKRALEPKLNDEQNSLFKIQAEESKKQFENWEQWRYEYLKKQIENGSKVETTKTQSSKKFGSCVKNHLAINV